MGNFMLTVIYDYGKLEHSAPITGSWLWVALNRV